MCLLNPECCWTTKLGLLPQQNGMHLDQLVKQSSGFTCLAGCAPPPPPNPNQ